MTEPDKAPVVRKRSRILAFLLNYFLAPSGYVYVGAIRAAFAYVIGLVLLGVLLCFWTYLDPPGAYGLPYTTMVGPFRGFLVLTVPISLGVGTHAAIAAGRLRPSTLSTGRRWLLAAGLFLAPIVLMGSLRILAPISLYSVPSVAMAPTLRQGDIIATFGSLLSCGSVQVHAGDVVAYRRSDEPGLHLHRAIAGPGSVIEIKHARVFVNKAPVTLSALGRTAMPFMEDTDQLVDTFAERRPGGDNYRVAVLDSDGMFENLGATRVPADSWFLIGDNRDNSLDSRSDGPVKQKDICGVAERVLWSSRRDEIGRRP